MKTNLKKHFKDRDPIDTINIITNFFKKHHFIINEIIENQTKSGTFFHTFELYFNNHKIVTANGKGITKEYSKASGLAELYERFCFIATQGNLVSKKNIDINKNKEKYLIPKEDFYNDEYAKSYFETFFPEYNEFYFNEFINNFYENKIYGEKFYNLNNSNDIIYKNSHMLYLTNGTTGLAAGNTLEEALVQGMSEFYERLVNKYFFENINNLNYQYYEINQNILPNNLKNIINQAEENDFCKIHIYDLSYTFNLPVVCLILQDLKLHTYYYCAGSFPIFEIAVERCLTEIYQGLYCHSQILKKIIFPQYYNWELLNINQNVSHFTNLIFIPENLLFNSKIINLYNTNIFLSNKNYSNIELLNWIKFINKINNLNIYYSDLSLCKDIKTIHIISKFYINKIYLAKRKTFIKQFNQEERIVLFEINNKIQNIYNKIIKGLLNNVTSEEIDNFFKILFLKAKPIFDHFGFNDGIQKILQSQSNLHSEIFNIFEGCFINNNSLFNNNYLIFNLYINNFNINQNLENSTILFNAIQPWFLLREFLYQNYSYDKIKKIFIFLNYNSKNKFL